MTGCEALVEESRALLGVAVLFDCHSMPHDALARRADGLRAEARRGARRPVRRRVRRVG